MKKSFEEMQSHFVEKKKQLINLHFQEENYGYLMHSGSNKAFTGTNVNRSCHSINGESLTITLTVPSSVKDKKKTDITIRRM